MHASRDLEARAAGTFREHGRIGCESDYYISEASSVRVQNPRFASPFFRAYPKNPYPRHPEQCFLPPAGTTEKTVSLSTWSKTFVRRTRRIGVIKKIKASTPAGINPNHLQPCRLQLHRLQLQQTPSLQTKCAHSVGRAEGRGQLFGFFITAVMVKRACTSTPSLIVFHLRERRRAS